MKTSLGAKGLLYPTPVLVVGTYDKAGRANAMTVAWGGIVCSQPPCVGISLRKATYTYENIVERKAFTVCISSEKYVKEVDYFGVASGKKVDKFAATGLTPVRSNCVDAPYIEEFPFVLECELLHTIEIGFHTQFIGEIKDVKAEESIVDEKGLVNVEKFQPMVYTPEIRKYYGIGRFLGHAFSMGKEI